MNIIKMGKKADKVLIIIPAYNEQDAIENTINFQHYGSKFLLGEVTQNIKINNFAYGTIKPTTTAVCTTTSSQLNSMASKMENGQCRWIDYIQPQGYTDPATGKTYNAFRLSFK